MAVPEFFRFIRPTLELLSDGQPQRVSDVEKSLIQHLKLTAADLAELIPSGKRTRVRDRVEWAHTYLRQAKLIESVGKGTNKISGRGAKYLSVAPQVIRPSDLTQFPEFADFQKRTKRPSGTSPQPEPSLTFADSTPEEVIASAFEQLNAALAQQVLDKVKAMPPAFFEDLIVRLMLSLGYGGPAADSGKTLGGSGDGGVDGVIHQDKLGLDNIYLQAKRWSDSAVDPKEVRAFVGALAGQGATKGVFITTSRFTTDAVETAKKNHAFKISLIDGMELARLMIENDLGVALVQRYEVKRVDSDFFTESED